jgi:hypothetical protein
MLSMGNKILRIRRALEQFLIMKLQHRIRGGEFDSMIKRFLSADFEGDIFEFTLTVQLLSNDVAFMNFLLDGSMPLRTYRRLYALWDRQNKDKAVN